MSQRAPSGSPHVEQKPAGRVALLDGYVHNSVSEIKYRHLPKRARHRVRVQLHLIMAVKTSFRGIMVG